MRRLLLRRGVVAPASPPGGLPPARTVAASVLGIDPGTLRVGYAVLVLDGGRPRALDFGVLKARPADSVDRRLGVIHAGLVRLIERWRPASVAIEAAFHGISASAALRIGEGRGAAIVAAAARGIPVSSYPPAVIKKAVVGNGNAHKRQVQAMAQALLGLASPPFPYDASDALAVALCALARGRLADRLARG